MPKGRRIWFKPEEWKQLERLAGEHGMTVQEFADHAVMKIREVIAA